jgi:two-component system, NarL family, sensor histidine kinase UhpB
VPLFRRVAAINAVLLLVAVGATIIVLVPGHQASYRIEVEGVVLFAVVVVLVLLNTFLLRRVTRPLQELTEVARTVDLTDPRPPMPDAEATSEAGELAVTFGEMLERLRAEPTGRVLAAQESERLRIAQELHDQVGQELTAVLLLLARLQARAPEELSQVVVDAQESIRSILEDVRRIAIELRPEALDDLGLESALAVLCDRFAERSRMEVSCLIAEPLPALSSDAELVIYRVAQEALTNVARHSGAGEAELSLLPDDGRVVLTVSDQGRGIECDWTPGSGVRGMRERAALVGAALKIDNRSPGPGTEVQLEVPATAAR